MATRLDIRTEVLAHGFSSANYSSRIDKWINEALKKIFRDADIRTETATSSFDTTSGGNSYPLPSDFNKLISLRITSTNPDVELKEPNDPSELDYVEDASGQPSWYRIIQNNIYLYPVPNSVQTLELRYWQLADEVTDDNTEIDLSEDYVFLIEEYCLYKAYNSEHDKAFADQHKAIFDAELTKFIGETQSDTKVGPKQVPGGWDFTYR